MQTCLFFKVNILNTEGLSYFQPDQSRASAKRAVSAASAWRQRDVIVA